MSEWKCPDCGSEYERPLGGATSDTDCCVHLVPKSGCDCYKCEGPEYSTHNGHEYISNNMEYHTYGELCDVCGKERTEYKDLGTKGRFVCPDQREHTSEEYANA